jgi:hypothetical protein
MADSAATQALVLAGQAKDTADGKRRVFVNTPYTPYDVGDLWVQGASGGIYRCKTARLTGSYSSSDWEVASKYTDDTALNNFINVSYNTQINDLVNQIDGKIESWFQTSDPSTSWTTTAIKAKHVGDMWFNSNTNKLKRYSSSYAWVDITDQTAIDAYNAASQAQDTADGKRRVFVSIPTSPYDIGDIWAQGEQGDIMVCKITKSSGEPYSEGDWEKAGKYTDDGSIKYLTNAIKNGSTEITGGLMLTNLLLMKNLGGIIRAGISGMDNDAVAFFAHDSDAYNVAINYLSGSSTIRPNFAVSKNGFLVVNIGRIGNANIADGDLILEGYDSNIIITNKRVQDVQFGSNIASSTIGSITIFDDYIQWTADISDTESNTYNTPITEGGVYHIAYNLRLYAMLRIDDTYPSSLVEYDCYIHIYIKKDNNNIQDLLLINKTETAYGRDGEYSVDTDETYSNTVTANIPAGSDIVFEYTAYYRLRTTNGGNSSCKLSILKNGSTPFFVASQVNKLTYLCSDGLVIAKSANSKFVVTSKNNQISIMADLPPQASASSGELCVTTDGTVKVK